jgi:hypothetical protein
MMLNTLGGGNYNWRMVLVRHREVDAIHVCIIRTVLIGDDSDESCCRRR